MQSNHQLRHFLSDVYSIEQQALAQLRSAPDVAGQATLAQHLRDHLTETEEQAAMVKRRLEAVGGSPSKIKDAVMRVGGKGFLLFAQSQPDTPGKLAAHAHSYEALEFAAYEMLIRAARLEGDEETLKVAETIREQEGAMRDRLAGDFEEAAAASLRKTGEDPAEALPDYLADAHALEAQAVELLKRGKKIAGAPELAGIYEEHRAESEMHAGFVEQRLEALGKEASTLKDSALAMGAVNWGLFFMAQDNTPLKLAAFAYAFEHLEIAGYELLKQVAKMANDTETVQLAEKILADERAMATRVLGQFDRAFEASLAA